MDFCVCCGAYVPEGTMVCLDCRRKYLLEEKDFPEMSGRGTKEEPVFEP